ncbi:hypothetical protein CJF31_00007766 [Rutstroemia sp. NJR-2017a BVV2]|nr:hypothetical protein CJF31_00005334 [Rutstroemia sp. NJR-2017a BVV2]PQE21933.1 hypothetical protein CJF31_00007766 [Rutstroemia sp. NJR-2017a BVV2]
MSSSANWRVRAPVDPPRRAEGSQDAGRSWRNSGSTQGSSHQHRQPIVPLAVRDRRDDLKVHRPERQHDEDDAARSIAQGRRIYLGNLLYRTTVEDLEEFLKSYGFLFDKVHISVDPVSGRNPGYCFIEFSDRQTADRAIAELEGKELLQRPVKCRPCQPKGEGRRSTHGWGESQESTTFNRWGDWNGAREGEHDKDVDQLAGKSGPYHAMAYFQCARTEDRQLYVGGLPRMLDQPMNEEEIRSIFKDFEV